MNLLPKIQPRLCALYLLATAAAHAQDTDILLRHDLYHYADRIDIRGYAAQTLHTDLKPYGRMALSRALRACDTAPMRGPERAWHQRMCRLADDSLALAHTGGPRLPWGLGRNGRDLAVVQSHGFEAIVNPVLHLAPGWERYTAAGRDTGQYLMASSRGAVIRGSLGGRVGFYTEVYDNQLYLPQAAAQRVFVPGLPLPQMWGEGFSKAFKPQKRSNGVDFFTSRAYITLSPIPNVMRIKLGKDRLFWGNGLQSLLLSDHAPDQMMLHITTRIWKIEYINHFAQLLDFVPLRQDPDGSTPRKYAAWHQLNFKPTPRLSLGIWEAVVYSPWQPNGRRGFEVQYLNPLIFYRAAEQFIGSPDNGLLAATFKYNFARRIQLYGQLLLDDFSYRNGGLRLDYWGNKLAGQLGLKYIGAFGLPTLDLQAEHNRIRPYVYQHYNLAASYANNGQPMAHPLGANAQDWLVEARWQPRPALHLCARLHHMAWGADSAGLNFGGNVQRPYSIARPADEGVRIGQGLPRSATELYARASWQLGSADAYLEAEARLRHQDGRHASTNALLGIRWGIPPRWTGF